MGDFMKKIIILILIITILSSTYLKKETNVVNKEEKDTYIEDVLGKIEIPKINVLNKIKEGTETSLLDENYVGHIKESSLNFNDTIILAGHNNKYVFKNLYKLKVKDEIILTLSNVTFKYNVILNTEIEVNDYTYFKMMKKTLILITCTKDQNKRRIVIAKRA